MRGLGSETGKCLANHILCFWSINDYHCMVYIELPCHFSSVFVRWSTQTVVGSSSIEQGFELCRKATESQFLHLSLYLLCWWLDSVFVSSIASWHSLQLIGEGWFCFHTLCVFSHTHGRPNENLRITACYNGSCKPKCTCWLF